MTPLISVVMPCYNGDRWLRKAIDSVLAQTFKSFELILIDDGSTDETWKIIQEYQSRDGRIIALHKENSGLVDTLNMGIEQARGSWIARMDQDDLCDAMRFKEQVAFLEKSPEVLLVGTDFIEIDENDTVIKVCRLPNQHENLQRNLEKMRSFFPHSSTFFRTDVVKAIGKYNPRIVCAEDYDLWLRIAEQGKIACMNKPLLKIRKHSQQFSNDGGGRTQALHGLAALVCHYLRSRKIADPSADRDDAEWRLFLEWIDDHAVQNKIFEQRQEWLQMRREYFAGSNRLIGALFLVIRLAQSRYSRQLLHDKLFGTSFPRKLAAEWEKKRLCVE